MKKLLSLMLCAVMLFTLCVSSATAASYVSPGSTVYFGNYLGSNIEWIVLTTSRGYALLLSKYVIDAHPWHTGAYNATWYNCSISNWLENNFYYEAFSSGERARMGSGSAGTVFLLSEAEAREYVRSYDLTAAPTYAAARRGAHVENNGCSWWWLRDVGNTHNNAKGVSSKGTVNEFHMTKESGGVRPAIWVSIDAL